MSTYLGSILLMNSDSVPLSVNFAGGLSMVFNFVGCNEECKSCPWEANVSRRSSKILEWQPRYSQLVKSTRPDVVVLHGAEPYLSPTSIAIAYSSESLGIATAIKVLGRNLHKFLESPIARYVDLILLELVSVNDLITVSSFRDVVTRLNREGVEIEFLLVLQDYKNLNEFTEFIDQIPRKPVSIVIANDRINTLHLLTIVLELRRRGFPFTSDPTNPSMEIASIYCPVCGAPVIARYSGVVYKLRLDMRGRCAICGYPIAKFRSRRLTRVPVSEVLA